MESLINSFIVILRYVQYISAVAHIFTVFLVEIFYVMVSHYIEKRNPSHNITNLENLRESAAQFIQTISPSQAELIITTIAASSGICYATVPVALMMIYGKKIICKDKLSCTYYLFDRAGSIKATTERLNYYLNWLIVSNRNHLRYLDIESPYMAIRREELDNELSFLMSLKRDQSHTWLDSRSDPKWFEWTRKTYLQMYSTNVLAYHFSCCCCIILFFRITRQFQDSRGLERSSGFWAHKIWFDVFFVVLQNSDLLAILIATMMIMLLDNVESMKSNRKTIRRFVEHSNAFKMLETSNEIESSSEMDLRETLGNLRSQCNEFAIISYIKLRYSLDTLALDNYPSLFQIVLGSSAAVILTMVFFYQDKNDRENQVLALVAITVFISSNGSLLTGAFRQSKYSKEMNRLILSLVPTIFGREEIKTSHQPITSHASLIWSRMIATQSRSMEQLEVRLFGNLLDYGSVIRMNFFVVSGFLTILNHRFWSKC